MNNKKGLGSFFKKFGLFAFLGLVAFPLWAQTPQTQPTRIDEGVDPEELKTTIESDPELRRRPARGATPRPASESQPQPEVKSEVKKDTPPASSAILLDEEKNRIITPKIRFQAASDTPVSSSRIVLRDLADFLQGQPQFHLRIEGHTDSVGYDQPNLELSQKRANKVKEILVEYGVDRSRLEAVGQGDRHPVASSVTLEGQEKNRRVEFYVMGSIKPEPLPVAPQAAPETAPSLPPVVPLPSPTTQPLPPLSDIPTPTTMPATPAPTTQPTTPPSNP